MRFLWLGTYEADYPRGAVLREGLRALGHDVVECHEPLWERTRHKADGFLAPASLARAGAAAARAWASLARRERRVGPVDAVVVGYPAQPDLPLGRLVARRRRVPLVADMMIALGDTLAGDRGRVGAAGGRVLTAVDRLARGARVVMADTRANADWMVAHLGIDPRRVAVVPVGAEPARFPAAPPPVPGAHVSAVFVGKLSPLHGLRTVLEAAAAPGTPPVTVVGDGQLMPWLRGRLDDGAPGVAHVPWIPYDRLGAEIARHHIVLGVFGTSDKASRVVPNKVWQALAVGRPVVTADTPGAREVLRDGGNALLVPPADAPALAAALRRLADDPGLRERMGAAARDTYERLGTPAVVAAHLVAAVEAA